MPIRNPQSAIRIISLVPSLTETLCAVGGRSQLVGCTAFCVRPSGLMKDRAVAKVGGTKTVKRERVLALKPDLILMNMEENTLEDIDYFRTRIQCYINGVKTVQSGIETIREVGVLIGAERMAHQLADKTEEILAAIRQRVAKKTALCPEGRRIFYTIWRNPWMTINADTFIHDHLQTCGAENVFASLGPSRYPEVTLEQIRAAQPDIVWLPSEPYRFTQKHVMEICKLKDIPAVIHKRVELVNGDNVCWFGTRQIEGVAYTFKKLWREPL